MTQPIIDAHHHIWRQADLPWLMGPMVPRIFGPYEPIRRDYPVEEYLADIAGSGVVKSVYVQANWAPERPWTRRNGCSRRPDGPAGRTRIVAYADLMAEDVRPELDRLARIPLVRGIRMQLHWHDNPHYRFAQARRPRRRPALPAEFSRRSPTMASASTSRSSRRRWRSRRGSPPTIPATTFILQHAGMLEDLSDGGARRMARRACGFSRRSRTSCRSSPGLGTFIHRNDPEHIAWIVRETVGALRRRPLPLRLEFPDREAVDGLCVAGRGLSRGGRRLSRRRSRRRCSTTRRRGCIGS